MRRAPSVVELATLRGARGVRRRARRRRVHRVRPRTRPRRTSRARCPASLLRPAQSSCRVDTRGFRIGEWSRHVERRRLRRGGRAGARRDRARRRLPGEPRAAPVGAVLRRPARSRRAGALGPLHPQSLAGDGWAIVSASPELFLARRGDRLWTKPIKGTRPLGEDVDDAKDAAEHVMIVDLERNDLSRVCEPGTIRWPELMRQRELAGVTHLVSTVEGRLRPGRRPRRDPARDVPRRLDHRCAEARRASTTSRASSPSGAARRWGRSARVRGERRLRARADDPHVRDRRRLDPPLGRRRHRLGLRPEAEIEESWVKARPLLAAVGGLVPA